MNQVTKRSKRGQHLCKTLDEILRRVDALPTIDSRTADEILGDDEHGRSGLIYLDNVTHNVAHY
jgi:hypothetical protein